VIHVDRYYPLNIIQAKEKIAAPPLDIHQIQWPRVRSLQVPIPMVLHWDQFPQMVCDTGKQILSTKYYSDHGESGGSSGGHPADNMAVGIRPVGAKSSRSTLGLVPAGTASAGQCTCNVGKVGQSKKVSNMNGSK